MGSVGPIKLWNWKTDDCKTQVMSMYSSMNIKHNNCTVNIGQFQLKIDFQANGKSRCLCKQFKFP